MRESVTLELPTELMRQARAAAAASNHRLDDAVADWVGRAVADPPVERLPDDQLLALCDSRLAAGDGVSTRREAAVQFAKVATGSTRRWPKSTGTRSPCASWTRPPSDEGNEAMMAVHPPLAPRRQSAVLVNLGDGPLDHPAVLARPTTVRCPGVP